MRKMWDKRIKMERNQIQDFQRLTFEMWDHHDVYDERLVVAKMTELSKGYHKNESNDSSGN